MLSRGSSMANPPIVGAGSTSLNHVLELLVAAQREILDTQRDLIQETASHEHRAATLDDCALIQRYQENSLGLLNAAAEGLVQVIMHWSPSLEGSTQQRFCWPVSALHDGDRSSLAPSSSLLVATLAEVEALETASRASASQSRVYQFLFRWTLARFRSTLRAYKQLEAENDTRTANVEEITDAIKVRSVLLIERVHNVQQSAMQALLASTLRVSFVNYFGRWSAFRAHRKKAHEISDLASRRNQADTLFRTFSMWHRGKLCGRIADLERQLEATNNAAVQHEEHLHAQWLVERTNNEAELCRLSVALQQSTVRVASLEDDVMRSQRLVEELTDQLGTSSRSAGATSTLQQLQNRQVEDVFQRRIDALEAELGECKRHHERSLAQVNAWVGKVVIPTVSEILDGTLHRGDVQHTFLLGAFVEGLQQHRSKPSEWSASQDDISVSSSMDSVDRGELMLKLSQLTQEVEVLRAEKTTTMRWSQPSNQYFSPLMRSASFDNIPRVASMGGEDPQQVLLEEQLRRTKRRLASLLGAKTKCLLAASCLRRWMVNAQSNRQKDELSAIERAHRHWVQNSVEERDKALVALDEQIQDDHHRIQAAMSVSRITHVDGSPSPLRNLSIDGGAISEGGGSPILPQSLRRWSVGYRSPGGPARLGLEPLATEALTVAPSQICTSDVATETEHGHDLVALENEELHTALSVSHDREQGLVCRLEDALKELEEERVASAEARLQAQTQEDRLVVTYAQLCLNEVVFEENTIRQHLEYNEQRARHHSLHALQSTLLSKCLAARDDALTECTKGDSRHHLQSCRLAATMATVHETSVVRRYWVVWEQFLMLRRFDAMSDVDRRTLQAGAREREEGLMEVFQAQMAEQVSRAEAQRRAMLAAHTEQVEHLNVQLERAQRELAAHTEQSHRREVESKQIVRQLRNDAVTGTLLASRLGIDVVEYCASSAFHAWRGFVAIRRSQRSTREQHSMAVFQKLTSKWQSDFATKIVEDISRNFFGKMACYLHVHHTVFNTVEESLRSDIELKDDVIQQNAMALSDLQQRVAALHLEATDVWKPRIALAEGDIRERALQHAKELDRCKIETTAMLEARFQEERLTLAHEHQEFCDELRESEALRNQELLQMQRDAYEQNIQRLQAESHQSMCADTGRVLLDAVAAERVLLMELRSQFIALLSATLHERCAVEAVQTTHTRDVIALLDGRLQVIGDYIGDVHHEAAQFRNAVAKVVAQERTKRTVGWMRGTADVALDAAACMRETFAEAHAQLMNLTALRCGDMDLIAASSLSAARNAFDIERLELVAYGRFLEECTSDLQRQLEEQRHARSVDESRSEVTLRAMQEALVKSAADERVSYEEQLKQLRSEHADAIEHMSIQFTHLQRSYHDVKDEYHRKQILWAHQLEDQEQQLKATIAGLVEQHKVEQSSFEKRLSQAAVDAATLKSSLEEDHRISMEHERKQADATLQHLKHSMVETHQQRSEALVHQASADLRSLESQHRSSIQALESSHLHDFEHLRSECHLRIREEVSLEIEHRLENITSSQQVALTAHLQSLERKLDERQRDHEEAISALKESNVLQVQTLQQQSESIAQRATDEISSLQKQLSSASVDRQIALSLFCEREMHLLNSAEQDARETLRNIAGAETVLVAARHQVVSQHTLAVVSILEEQTRNSTELLAVGERQTIVVCADAALSAIRDHEAQVHLLEASHEGNLSALTTTLLDESRRAIARGVTDARTAERQTTVTKGLRVLRNASLCLLAQRTIYKWRLWALVQAFREDYRNVRDERNQTFNENQRLRKLVEQALEEHRTYKSRSISSMRVHNHETDSPTLLSPLSDEESTLLKHHVSPLSTNNSIHNDRGATTPFDSIVHEVDDLIQRGRLLRTKTMTHPQTESF